MIKNTPKFKQHDRVFIISKRIEGTVFVVDPTGGGVYDGVETSYDIMTEDILYKHIPESDVIAKQAYKEPVWGNHYWFCGIDLIPELKHLRGLYQSKRMYEPFGMNPVIIDTKVFRVDVYHENYLDIADGWHSWRAEMSLVPWNGSWLVWIEEWNESIHIPVRVEQKTDSFGKPYKLFMKQD